MVSKAAFPGTVGRTALQAVATQDLKLPSARHKDNCSPTTAPVKMVALATICGLLEARQPRTSTGRDATLDRLAGVGYRGPLTIFLDDNLTA